jgi:hypothetical protein
MNFTTLAITTVLDVVALFVAASLGYGAALHHCGVI